MNKFWMAATAVLLLAACRTTTPIPIETVGKIDLKDFGSNPGDLQARLYVPENAMQGAALVVAMHGCGQSAEQFAEQSGWIRLADREGIVVLFPEQKAINNVNRCFNWFLAEDQQYDSGEALSIYQMIQKVIADFGVNEEAVYATGFSAGGAMTAVMLATYPDVFAGGAPLAGIPYGAADNLMAGLTAMQGVDREPATWAQAVRDQRPDFTGAYPKVMVIQGATDNIVQPTNAVELFEQWAGMHNLSVAGVDTEGSSAPETSAAVRIASLADGEGNTQVALYWVDDLGHAYPIDPGAGPQQGGTEAPFITDADWWATYWIAAFFGLVE